MFAVKARELMVDIFGGHDDAGKSATETAASKPAGDERGQSKMLHEEKHDSREDQERQSAGGNRFVRAGETWMIEQHEHTDGDEHHQRTHTGCFRDHERGAGIAQWHTPIDFEQTTL